MSNKRNTDQINDSSYIAEGNSVFPDNTLMNKNDRLGLADFLNKHYPNSSDLTELSKKVGVASTTLREWSYGRTPSLKHLDVFLQICEIHQISLESLLCSNRGIKKAKILLCSPVYENNEVKLTLQILQQDKQEEV